MPILGTGKQAAGYTLLEVVAVVTLIGLIIGLTYPRINLAVEQVEVGYMGRLIKADFNLIRNESIADPSSVMVVTFTPNGYSFAIGEHRINRSFKYQFVFEPPASIIREDSQAGGAASGRAVATDKSAADEGLPEPQTDQQGNNAGQAEKTAESHDLKILNGEFNSGELQIPWKTRHFRGSFLYRKDGTVEWKYGKK
jgi:prepilin-type N-terminal cleavage/methylation domain-containing protein